MGEYKRSGQTQEAFAQKRGVTVSALRYWIYKERGRSSRPVGLVPVGVATTGGYFEVRVGQVGLRFEVGTEPAYVVSLLRELSGPC